MSMITKMLIRTKTVQLVIALSCAVPSQAVFAADGTIYPGMMCHADGAKHWDAGYGMVSNPSLTARLPIDCPIVRQQTERAIDPGSWVRLVDQHTPQNIDCEIVSIEVVSINSLGAWWSGKVRSAGNFPNVQVRMFGGVAANNNSNATMFCSLPPIQDGRRSYLTSYKIQENN